MTEAPTFSAVISKGKMLVRNETEYNAYLWKLKDGEEVKVKITRKRRDRSRNQNNWYWGVVLPVIAKETGHSPDELHEIFKRMFLTPKEVEYKGHRIKMPGSTSSLSISDFTDYVERVRAEAAQMGITVPDPE
jgi:hypothetical protein